MNTSNRIELNEIKSNPSEATRSTMKNRSTNHFVPLTIETCSMRTRKTRRQNFGLGFLTNQPLAIGGAAMSR
jgi:hypothetical protein